MSAQNYTDYTDMMWLTELRREGVFGPIEPLEFKPAWERLYYYDHDSPEFFVRPLITRFGFSEEDDYGFSTAKVEFDGETLIYSLSTRFWDVIEKQVALGSKPPLCWRLFCSHLQFSIYTKSYDFPQNGVFLDFGDAPKFNHPVLAYCTAYPDHFCVVDPFFIISKAYFRLQEQLAHQDVTLADKEDAVFWRGSASGVRTNFAESQRYLLCSKMETSKHRDRLDFGIINTPQHFLDRLARELGGIPSFAQPAARVSPDTFSRYRYGVDVDGNSNSWGGFFTKMLSRAYLFRISSLESFRQWYYPRLEERSLYSKIAADLSDFDNILDDVFSLSLQEMEERTQGLYQFARSMNVFEEIHRNNARLNTWLSHNSFKSSISA